MALGEPRRGVIWRVGWVVRSVDFETSEGQECINIEGAKLFSVCAMRTGCRQSRPVDLNLRHQGSTGTGTMYTLTLNPKP